MDIGGLVSTQCDGPVTKECYVDTLVGNLNRRKSRCETELQQVNAALEALKKNPEIANILELISKVGR